MQAEDTLYDVLEISPRASTFVVKAAYRCLAQAHHPDKNAGSDTASARLVQINHAYSVLSDPVKRLRYDGTLESHGRAHERRGAGKALDGRRGGTAAAGSHMSRPFGFRPLG